MKQNVAAKVMATIALLAIVIGIVGTGLIFVFSAIGDDETIHQQEISQEELNELIEQFSGSLDTSNTLTGETQ